EPDGSVTMLTRPAVTVDRDLEVVMDARLGKPVSVTSPGAGQVYGYAGFTRRDAAAGVLAGSFAGITAAQIGPATTAAGFRSEFGASWASGTQFWAAAWSVPGRWVTGFTRTPRNFVSRRAVYGGDGAALMVRHPAGAWGYASALDLPVTRTEHLLAGPSWGGEFTGAQATLTAAAAPVTTATDEWNSAVRGPAFAPGHAITETRGVLDIAPAWRSDSSGHGAPASGSTRVTRGKRITIAHTDGADRVEWAFAATRSATRTVVPLPVVRFRPADDTLSFTVQHQAGGGVTEFGLDVSYDGGHTWQRPFYMRVGDRGLAVLRAHPGSTVSLRATATNSAGNSVRQTLLNAF
ncbi:hypothetical protein AB0M20_45260, partial [Actinoplanes sp. NPDC051633]|uniref:hypothetical protein n=1 Tax=Actinoplanes sp. NPDC051633 TaxID=3155670 RepID=UPI00341D0C80